jgi:hypothetical protein
MVCPAIRNTEIVTGQRGDRRPLGVIFSDMVRIALITLGAWLAHSFRAALRGVASPPPNLKLCGPHVVPTGQNPAHG